MGVYEFNGYKPVIHESAFIHPAAVITGNVTIGKNVYVGPGAAIRGDWGEIIISDGCNVQENCTVHVFPGVQMVIMEDAHIGHGAIVHGGNIGKNVLVGMNAVIMDHAIIGDDSIIGALSFIPEGMEIPPRKVAAGNPVRIIKDVTDEMLQWKKEGTELYKKLPSEMFATWKPCEPLREQPAHKPKQQELYKNWKRK